MDSSMVSIIYKDAKDAIKAIAESLGVASEYVFEVLVKQQVVDSIVWLIVNIVLILLVTIGSKKLYKYYKTDDYDDDLVSFLIGLLVVATVATAVVFIASISTIVTGFVNPEYGAMREIFNVIKGK